MISLATYERIFVMLGTAFFSIAPNLLAFGSAISVVELIRNRDPTTSGFALSFVLVCCVALPFLVVMGREFAGLRRTGLPGRLSKAETL